MRLAGNIPQAHIRKTKFDPYTAASVSTTLVQPVSRLSKVLYASIAEVSGSCCVSIFCG
jgi:hypothetical protein